MLLETSFVAGELAEALGTSFRGSLRTISRLCRNARSRIFRSGRLVVTANRWPVVTANRWAVSRGTGQRPWARPVWHTPPRTRMMHLRKDPSAGSRVCWRTRVPTRWMTWSRSPISNRPAVGRHQPPEPAGGEAWAGRRTPPRIWWFEKTPFKSTRPLRKRIAYNGAGGVYICVIGTLCEPLFAQFPCDSWIRLFENPQGAAEHKREKPAETPPGTW